MTKREKSETRLSVVGYVRVSTENQLENYSIEEQVERIKAYSAAKGWVLLKTYTDGGYSGGNIDRPALHQMLRDIKASHVDAVVVYKLDRLSRSQKDTLMLIEDEFLSHDIDFISINENFDTSSSFGRAMIGILSVFAQLEKDQITERFMMGRIGRGKAGYYHGGSTAPTGYVYQDGNLAVDEYRALIVQEIYKSFLAGKSINAIERAVREKCDGKWSASKIRNILSNSIYIGRVKFAGIEYAGLHEPIISSADFDAAQNLLASFEREEGKTSSQKSPFRAGYLLSSLITCAKCGARYSANHGYYKCYSRAKSSSRFVVDPSCKNENWQIETLDSLVVSEIRNLFDNPSLLSDLIACSQEKKYVPDAAKINRRITEIEKQLERAVELYQVEGAPIEIISRNIRSLDLEKRRLNEELKSWAEGKTTQKDQFIKTGKEFCRSFDLSPLETKRQIIGSLIDTVVIDGTGFNIKWRL